MIFVFTKVSGFYTKMASNFGELEDFELAFFSQPGASEVDNSNINVVDSDSSEGELVIDCEIKGDVEVISEKRKNPLEKEPPLLDFSIQHEGLDIEIRSRPSHNPLTNSDLNVDLPFGRDLSQEVFTFRNGYNLHALRLIWGQIDQLCMRRQRFLRLMALLNMVNPNHVTKAANRALNERQYHDVLMPLNKIVCSLRAQQCVLSGPRPLYSRKKREKPIKAKKVKKKCCPSSSQS